MGLNEIYKGGDYSEPPYCSLNSVERGKDYNYINQRSNQTRIKLYF